MRITKIIRIYTIILALTFILAGVVHAATTMEIGIPGQINPGAVAPTVPEYIKYLYLFVLGFVGIAGFASIVFWGAVWAGSGVVDKKAAALDGIKNALYGIGIALTAFILLNTINPDLTVIRAPSVEEIKITSDNKKVVVGEGTYTWVQINPNRNDTSPYNQNCLAQFGSGWQTAKDESRCGDRPYQGTADSLYSTYQKLPASKKYDPYVFTCCFLPAQLNK